jgi:ABC-2 type transport system ATP-binding protein
MMERTAIAVHGVTKAFGRKVAVDDLTFEVGTGIVTAFLGPNGAGKTTTMRMILGLARPDAGTATVLGVPYRALPEPARSVGSLLDSATFHPGRTGRDHLRWIAAAAGVHPHRVDTVLELVELVPDADRRVGGYSLGMRQRLGLAAALLGDPRLLILDEPANGLDPAGIRWLRGFLRSFAAAGGTVFVSSHLLGEVAQLADEFVVIDRGKLIAHTTSASMTGGDVATRVRTSDDERLRLIRLLEAAGARVHEHDGALEVQGLRPEAIGEATAAAGITLYELNAHGRTVEDAFFDLVRQRREEDDDVAVRQG